MSPQWPQIQSLELQIQVLSEENKRLKAAIKDAQHLIDNDLVCVWIMAHKLDYVLK